MPEQIELFQKKKPKEKEKKRKPQFEAVIDGFGVETIKKTEKAHQCFVCNLPIEPGSKAEKRTPVVDERPLWYQAIYRHKPVCPPPEDEPSV